MLLSVSTVPPKSVKWPMVCLLAAKYKFSYPVIYINGINQTKHPPQHDKNK